MEPVFFRAQGRADLGQINDGGRALPCTGEKQWIFDSLVSDFETTHDMEIRNEQSEQTLNCALSVDFLWNQRLKIGRSCVRLRAETDYEWSDFVGAVAAADANFEG